MEKQELVITVSGTCASGKSRVLFLLKESLRSLGFDVERQNDDDHTTEEKFDKVMSRDIREVIEKIKESSKVTFKEITVKQ